MFTRGAFTSAAHVSKKGKLLCNKNEAQYTIIVLKRQIFLNFNCIANNKIYKKFHPNDDKFHIKKCKEKSDLYQHFICFFQKKLYDYIYQKIKCRM